MADDEKNEKKPNPRKLKWVTIHLPSPGAKVFTSMGTIGNGARVQLPEAEARRFMDLGKARLTEGTEATPGDDVTVIEDRPVTP